MAAHIDLVAEVAVVQGGRHVEPAGGELSGQRQVVVRFRLEVCVAPDVGLALHRHLEFHVELFERRVAVAVGVIAPDCELADVVFDRRFGRDVPAEAVVPVGADSYREAQGFLRADFVLHVQRTCVHAFQVVVSERIQVEMQLFVDQLEPCGEPVVFPGFERPQ